MGELGVAYAVVVILMASRVDCASNTTHGCSSLCSIAFDEDLTCWNGTRSYFTDVLVGSMKRYVTTQASIIKWNKYHGRKPTSEDVIVKDSADRMNNLPSANIDDDSDILDEAVVFTVVRELVGAAEEMAKDRGSLPGVECPLGCEHGWNLWMWLTIASLCLSGVIVAVMLTATIRMDRIDRMGEEFEQIQDADGRCCNILDLFGLSA